MRISGSMERILRREELMGARGKHTELPTSYPELLSAAPKELRGDQSNIPITLGKDKGKLIEGAADSGIQTPEHSSNSRYSSSDQRITSS